mmetsp:Transcript_28175/g.62153  ORF Transcript_28175/g.62153 Transcript_28175/m.62153 type:complete len:178 (+) Transcript_28175:33-566(+)
MLTNVRKRLRGLEEQIETFRRREAKILERRQQVQERTLKAERLREEEKRLQEENERLRAEAEKELTIEALQQSLTDMQNKLRECKWETSVTEQAHSEARAKLEAAQSEFHTLENQLKAKRGLAELLQNVVECAERPEWTEDWECKGCTWSNNNSLQDCEICDRARPPVRGGEDVDEQ